MTTESNQSENSNESNGTEETTIAETVGVVRSALARLEDDADEPSCQAYVSETGYYVLEDPSNRDAWIRSDSPREVGP